MTPLAQKLSNLGVVLPSFSILPSSWTAARQPQQARRFTTVDGLIAHWHDTWPQDSILHLSWDHLVRTAPAGTSFHTAAWHEALARAYIRAGRYRLLTVNDGADVVGVFPLQLNSGGSLESIGSMMSDYLDPLVSQPRTDAVWASFLQAINRVPAAQANQVSLHHCRPEHVDLDAIQSAATNEGFAVSIDESSRTSGVALASTWDDYLARLDGHDRKEIRRKLRNAQTKAGAELFVAQTSDDVRAALDTVFAFMRQGGGSKGMKAQWTFRPMFKRAADGLVEAGRLKVYMLRLEGRDAAGLIAFPTRSGPLLWSVGHDASMSKWSPGIVLFALTMQRSIEEGAAYFDLLRGQQRYKHEFGAVEKPTLRITLRKL